MEEENPEDLEKELAKQVAVVEFYYSISIGPHYPLLKRFNQMEQLNYIFEMDAKRLGLTQER